MSIPHLQSPPYPPCGQILCAVQATAVMDEYIRDTRLSDEERAQLAVAARIAQTAASGGADGQGSALPSERKGGAAAGGSERVERRRSNVGAGAGASTRKSVVQVRLTTRACVHHPAPRYLPRSHACHRVRHHPPQAIAASGADGVALDRFRSWYRGGACLVDKITEEERKTAAAVREREAEMLYSRGWCVPPPPPALPHPCIHTVPV